MPGGATTTAGGAIATPGRGTPIPMPTPTPAREAVTTPSNTAVINSILFIHRLDGTRRQPVQAEVGFFARFSLNKPGAIASSRPLRKQEPT